MWSRGRCRRIKRSHSHGTLNVYKAPVSTRSSVRHWSVTPAWAKVSSVQESQTKSIPCRQLSHMWPALLILALSLRPSAELFLILNSDACSYYCTRDGCESDNAWDGTCALQCESELSTLLLLLGQGHMCASPQSSRT